MGIDMGIGIGTIFSESMERSRRSRIRAEQRLYLSTQRTALLAESSSLRKSSFCSTLAPEEHLHSLRNRRSTLAPQEHSYPLLKSAPIRSEMTYLLLLTINHGTAGLVEKLLWTSAPIGEQIYKTWLMKLRKHLREFKAPR